MKRPDPEPRPNPITALCASPANETAPGASTEGNAPAEPAAPDTSWMDIQAQVDLELATREYMAGRDMAQRGIRRMADAVAIAHDATVAYATNCRNGENGKFEKAERTFGAWCDSLEINRKNAERLLNVAKMFDESSPKEQKILNELSPSLLYAAARPSAPPELVAGVKNGDITTHKQYQDLLAELQAEKEGRVNDNRNLMDEINAREKRIDDLIAASEEQERRAIEAEGRAKTAQMNINSMRSRQDSLEGRLEDAHQAANEYHQKYEQARGERDALLDREAAYIGRIRELEARPIDVAVRQPSEAEIEQYRQEGEQRAQNRLDAAQNDAKKLLEKVKSLKEQLQGKADHLAAVEKENARLRAQVGETRRVDAVSCTACIYEPKCCGLNMMDTDEDALDQMNRRLIGCAAGKMAGE